jgi:hypothetical protein
MRSRALSFAIAMQRWGSYFAASKPCDENLNFGCGNQMPFDRCNGKSHDTSPKLKQSCNREQKNERATEKKSCASVWIMKNIFARDCSSTRLKFISE